jgi:hypothetical protein
MAAVAVSAPVATRSADFTIVKCWALVTALVIEQIVGPDLRNRRPGPSESQALVDSTSSKPASAPGFAFSNAEVTGDRE